MSLIFINNAYYNIFTCICKDDKIKKKLFSYFGLIFLTLIDMSDVESGNSSAVERFLAKEEVAGANPVSRSITFTPLRARSL